MFQSATMQGIMFANQQLGLATGQATLIDVQKRGYSHDITVQIKEDGMLSECNHAGHQLESISFKDGMDDEYSLMAYVCDKDNCKAWSHDAQEWNS